MTLSLGRPSENSLKTWKHKKDMSVAFMTCISWSHNSQKIVWLRFLGRDSTTFLRCCFKYREVTLEVFIEFQYRCYITTSKKRDTTITMTSLVVFLIWDVILYLCDHFKRKLMTVISSIYELMQLAHQ